MKKVAGIWLPDDDRHFAKHLAAGPKFEGAGTYQYAKIRAILEFIPNKRRRVALDIGAHVGLWARVLAREFQCINAFEPVPELLACFDLNTDHLSNVEVWPCALSDSEGVIQLIRPDGNSGNWHVLSDGEKPKYEASTFPLDHHTFDFSDVDLIKIDVEGWELPVLKGAKQLLDRCKPFIVIEQKVGNAERYGFGRYDAARQLEEWGALRLWERSGDILYGWE